MNTSLNPWDLAALVLSIGGIALYGMWVSRRKESATEFLSGTHQSRWRSRPSG